MLLWQRLLYRLFVLKFQEHYASDISELRMKSKRVTVKPGVEERYPAPILSSLKAATELIYVHQMEKNINNTRSLVTYFS